MDWLVHIVIERPEGATDDEVAERLRAEADAARAFADSGALVRIWRIPGQWASWSVWRFGDATEVHAALSSLPLWSWATMTVHPLAAHPNDPV